MAKELSLTWCPRFIRRKKADFRSSPDKSHSGTVRININEAETNESETQDSSNIRRFQNGDATAFDDLVHRHLRWVYNFAFQLSRDRDEASDVVSNTLIRVFKSLNRFRGDSSFTSWVYRIELNCFLDIRRKSRSGSILSLDAVLSGRDGSVILNIIDDQETPHDHLERHERRSKLERAIKHLSKDQMETFMLSQADEMSYEQIAEKLDIPIGTVKSRLHRARFHIRRSLLPQINAARASKN